MKLGAIVSLISSHTHPSGEMIWPIMETASAADAGHAGKVVGDAASAAFQSEPESGELEPNRKDLRAMEKIPQR
jgi:hypothetical protein